MGYLLSECLCERVAMSRLMQTFSAAAFQISSDWGSLWPREFLAPQTNGIRQVTRCSCATLKLSFDESEQTTTYRGELCTWELIMMHARLRWTCTGRQAKHAIGVASVTVTTPSTTTTRQH